MNQMVFFAACRLPLAACRAADLSRQLLDILQFVAAGRGVGYGGSNGLGRPRTREMARANPGERLVEVVEHFVHLSAHQPGKEDLWLGLVWSGKKKTCLHIGAENLISPGQGAGLAKKLTMRPPMRTSVQKVARIK
jgi:hypothetical protein